MTSEQNTLRQALREVFPRDRGQLLPALHYLQHEFGHLPGWALEVVAWHLCIPSSEVYGAATSYSELRLEKPGEHVVRVCTALSCSQNGGKDILQSLESDLDRHEGTATANGHFKLEETHCGFLCGMAPAVEIGGQWRGRVTPDEVHDLIDWVTGR